MSIVVYPGTFDPVTNGHLDLIKRASAIFDRVVVALPINSDKAPLFTMDERIEMLHENIQIVSNVGVGTFEGLVADYAKSLGARVLLRGIRAVSDYEYELQMAMMNRKLAPELETIFMIPCESYSYLSSSLVRAVVRHGGSVSGLVPPAVEAALRKKLGKWDS
jgi:pantetheine-phosphate adenylyltransferase